MLEPFLPFTMQQLRSYLNCGALPWSSVGDTGLISAGHQLEKPGLLFRKIEDSEVEAQVNKLLATKQANQAREAALAAAAAPAEAVASAAAPEPPAKAEAALPPAKPIITYDEFSVMDIRIGTILEAEKVKGSDKLLQLRVDTGLDVRTIVSGIAEHFEPASIVGKQVSLLANLAPRKIRGIESQGMILLAEDNQGRLIFVVPETGTENGSVVR